jgi:integrase
LPLDLGEKALISELKRLGQKALENVFLEEESLPITVEDNLQEKNELVEVDILKQDLDVTISEEIEEIRNLPFQTEESTEILKKLTSIFNLSFKTYLKTNETNDNLKNDSAKTIKLLQSLQTGVLSLKDEALKEKNIIKSQAPFLKALREPITDEQYEILMIEAYSLHIKHSKYQFHRARFRLIYTLLFFTGLRINEVALLSGQEILQFIQDRKLEIKMSKVNRSLIKTLPKAGQLKLKSLMKEFDIVFKEYGMRTLADTPGTLELENLKSNNLNSLPVVNNRLDQNFSQHKGRIVKKRNTLQMSKMASLFRILNEDMQNTAVKYNFSGIDISNSKTFQLYSSHSFRIGFISRLLDKNYPIEKAASLAGHVSLDTTREYYRFRPDVSELDNFFPEEEMVATDDLFDNVKQYQD